MINFKELPFYIHFTVKLFMVLLLGVLVIYAKNIVVPLAFSILLSILLLPVSNFLVQKLRFPKIPANLIVVLFALAFIAFIVYIFSHQVARFLNDVPSIKQHLESHYETLMLLLSSKKLMIRGWQILLITPRCSS